MRYSYWLVKLIIFVVMVAMVVTTLLEGGMK